MQEKPNKSFNILFPVFIFSLAFFIRTYNLTLFSLNHDEATWTLRSIDNFDKFMGIPVACFQGYIQPFFSYLVFFAKKVFSLPIYIVRIPAVIIGVATVMLTYKLAKEMYGRKAGLASALLLCFLPWHVIQSRIGVSLILTPFFGCLIFLALFKAIRKRSSKWFIFSGIFLSIGSFYTYQASLLFVPIFLTALWCLRKGLRWLKPKIILISILIFLIILCPLICLQITGRISQYSERPYRMYYQDEPFKDTAGIFLAKSVRNFKNNSPVAFETLFFASHGRMLYGAAMESPLLINWISILIILFSITFSLRCRQFSDKILLIWLVLGCLGGLSGIRFFQPRYIIIALIPFLILIGRFITEIFNNASKKSLS